MVRDEERAGQGREAVTRQQRRLGTHRKERHGRLERETPTSGLAQGNRCPGRRKWERMLQARVSAGSAKPS